jgi:hypothetical protein
MYPINEAVVLTVSWTNTKKAMYRPLRHHLYHHQDHNHDDYGAAIAFPVAVLEVVGSRLRLLSMVVVAAMTLRLKVILPSLWITRVAQVVPPFEANSDPRLVHQQTVLLQVTVISRNQDLIGTFHHEMPRHLITKTIMNNKTRIWPSPKQ